MMDLMAWREKRAEGERFRLPSGLVVTLKPADLLDLVAMGQIPVPLAGAVNRVLDEGVKLTAENFGEFAPVINLTVKACLVDPPVAEEADEGHLGIEELPVKDRLAIYNWANQGVVRLVPFREKKGEPGDAGLPGEAVPEEAE